MSYIKKDDSNIPRFTQTTTPKKCTSCWYCKTYMHLSCLDKSERVTYICGVHGYELGNVPLGTKIEIEKRCEYTHFRLTAETINEDKEV